MTHGLASRSVTVRIDLVRALTLTNPPCRERLISTAHSPIKLQCPI